MHDEFPPINKDDAVPRHVQVQRSLEHLISSGLLRPGDKIPAETDLALRFGVSKMTVNKAILTLTAAGRLLREVGRGTFVVETRAARFPAEPRRVQAPHIVVAVNTQKSSIGEDYYYGPLYHAIHDQIQETGGTVSLARVAEGRYQRHQAARDADGWLIIAPSRRSLPDLAALAHEEVPAVVLGASWSGSAVPSVDSDNQAGSRLAVRHLLEQGHHRFLLVYAEPEAANVLDRREGYQDALRAAGREASPADEVQAEFHWRLGERARAALTKRLTAPDRPTALYAAGFYLALEILNLAAELGLRVPYDLSVVGFDDPTSAQLLHPPLTTVRQPLNAMGEAAVALLLRRLHGEPLSSAPILLPPELIVRASTAPPRG